MTKGIKKGRKLDWKHQAIILGGKKVKRKVGFCISALGNEGDGSMVDRVLLSNPLNMVQGLKGE